MRCTTFGSARAAITLALVATAAACQVQPPGPALQVLTETARPRGTDALPARSAIFDGAVVRLRGVRGETLGVEVARGGRTAATVLLTLDGVEVRGFAVDHAVVQSPSTVMYGASRGAGTYPDRLTPVRGPVPTPRMAYFDVAIGADLAPGRYRGELVVDDRRWPVELTVDATVLPALDAQPWVWAYYDARELPDADTEARTAALFRRHGVIASPELTADTWEARRAQVAGLRFVPVLLPREPEGIAADVPAWIARTAGTGVVPFAIPIDEPRRDDARAKVRTVSAQVRAAGGGPGRFLYAVTAGPHPALGDAIDVYIAPTAVRGGVPAGTQAWTYNGAPGWAGAMVVDADDGTMRSWGWLGFVYDVPLWYVWDALYWRDRHNRGRDRAPAHDLLTSSITFDDGEDHGALDGVLVYPGPLPSLRLMQLRRGLLDRLLLEAVAARRGRDVALAIARTVVPAAGPPRWPADDAAWEHLRVQLLDALE